MNKWAVFGLGTAIGAVLGFAAAAVYYKGQLEIESENTAEWIERYGKLKYSHDEPATPIEFYEEHAAYEEPVEVVIPERPNRDVEEITELEFYYDLDERMDYVGLYITVYSDGFVVDTDGTHYDWHDISKGKLMPPTGDNDMMWFRNNDMQTSFAVTYCQESYQEIEELYKEEEDEWPDLYKDYSVERWKN